MVEYLIDMIGDDIYAHLEQTTETSCTSYNGHRGTKDFRSCCYTFRFGDTKIKVYENNMTPYSIDICPAGRLNTVSHNNLDANDVIDILYKYVKEEENGNS